MKSWRILFICLFFVKPSFAEAVDEDMDYIEPSDAQMLETLPPEMIMDEDGEVDQELVEKIRAERERYLKQQAALKAKKEEKRKKETSELDKLSRGDFSNALDRFIDGGMPSKEEKVQNTRRQKLSKPGEIEVVEGVAIHDSDNKFQIDLFGDPIVKTAPVSDQIRLSQKKAQPKTKSKPLDEKKVTLKPKSNDESSRALKSNHSKIAKKIRDSKNTKQTDRITSRQAKAIQRVNAELENEIRISRLPFSDKSHPSASFEFLVSSGASSSLSQNSISSSSQTFRHVSLQAEWLPEILSGRAGHLSLGAKLSLYPKSTKDDFSVQSLTDWAIGSQIRYQLRYFQRQPLVPIIGYHLDFRSHFASSIQNKTNLLQHGPTLGAWFLLNVIDRSLSRSFYKNAGVLRTYFVFEWRRRMAKNDVANLDESEFELGLRFEF